MSHAIFGIIMLMLYHSSAAPHMGCDAPPPAAVTECWTVNPDTGRTAWITAEGIEYTGAGQ